MLTVCHSLKRRPPLYYLVFFSLNKSHPFVLISIIPACRILRPIFGTWLLLHGLQYKLHSSKERVEQSHSIALSWWLDLSGSKQRRAKKETTITQRKLKMTIGKKWTWKHSFCSYTKVLYFHRFSYLLASSGKIKKNPVCRLRRRPLSLWALIWEELSNGKKKENN